MNVNVRSRCRLGVLLLAVTVGSVAAARAEEGERQSGQPRFTARDIKRSYGFSCSGTVVAAMLPPQFLGPLAQVGQVSCDGRDTCVGAGMASFNGNIVSVEVTGKYTVNPNGTGLVIYDLTVGGAPAGQSPVHFVITDGGRGIKGVFLSPGFAVTCDLKEQKGQRDDD